MKRQTSPTKLYLLLAIVALTWTACNQSGTPDDIDMTQARGHIIPLKEAIAYQNQFLKTYDTTLRKMVGTPFLTKDFRIPNAETFNKHAIKLLLHESGCDSIRIYYGMDSTGGMRLILMGIDKYGKCIYTNLLSQSTTAISVPFIPSARAQSGNDTDAVENGQTCPPCQVGFH